MKHVFLGLAIALAAGSIAFAQDQVPEDGVIASCMDKGNSAKVCICASVVLTGRIGEAEYARFGEIEDRLAALSAGAEESREGEQMALMSEGYRHFVPHGRAISLCAEKIGSGE